MEGSLVAYKVFTNGSVLNASEINENLMNQSVMVFSNSTVRASALTSPLEGMLTWLEDTNVYQYWNGSAWTNLIGSTDLPGLVLIGKTDFSAIATQSINDVFSTTYDRYLVKTEIASASTNIDVRFRLRVSGTDATGFDYTYAASGLRSTGGTFTSNDNGQGFVDIGRGGTSFVCHANLEVINPFKTVKTVLLGQYGGKDSTSTFVSNLGAYHDLANSYTGFTIYPTTGNMTGSVAVYGFRK
jgi:hypothetical protein